MNNEFDALTKNMAQSVTRRAALKKFGLGLAGMALARFGLNQAQAITNGMLDGNAHPNVGGVVWLKSPWPPTPAPLACGCGTLIHPRVLLTAGHGTHLVEDLVAQGAMTLGDLLVSFAPSALDPATWRGISSVLTHPDYAAVAQTENGAGAIPLPDVGVLIFREPVTGIQPAPLPPVGFLDLLQAAGKLRSGSDQAKFTVVGYGAALGDPVGQVPFPPEGVRRVAQSGFLNLDSRWLFLDQNGAQGNGGGGTCDSGGPAFWVDPATGTTTPVALTSRGDARSVAVGIDYRVDTSEALTFLTQVIGRVEAGEL